MSKLDKSNFNVYSQTNINYQQREPIDIPQNSDEKALKHLFKIALESRNFEITQLVQRNNFFMVFQGVIFMGLIQSAHTVPVVSFMICVVGLVTSVFQAQMAAGAKFWQEYWEATLTRLEHELLLQIHDSTEERRCLYSLFHNRQERYNTIVREKIGGRSRSLVNKMIMNRHSVSRIPIYVAISLGLIWFLLMLCTMASYSGLSVPSFIVGF
ncbi:hypothetical protein ACEWAO_14480 [Vibrio parahaemolyticus]|uniref:RipA family octameric membrane protein n=1 Tax=Vibrio TaxID=662 RepID=UPI000403E56E|nr:MULTISPECIES: hypothetical protein [Vibrio]BDP35017.1 hypothetical protein VA208B3_13880 [Vibrio alginolyticus]HDY7881480.1 hypothetical protein [Vibrio vulnificus]EHH2421961.1 hypothetical protein [Vibrio parahaemolyticus]ELA9815316.1 hypothetical protein [Vibrio parahaemolyticus]ELA9890100.1 hypothetical protein [Vibrio parahaemolyticus]